MRFVATQEERERRDEVAERVLRFIREDRPIKLPPFVSGVSEVGDFALQAMQPNDFSGSAGGFRYQFEGEDDLLHIAIFREDRGAVPIEHARQVLAFLLPEVAPGLIWVKIGQLSQHFYVGHDELVR